VARVLGTEIFSIVVAGIVGLMLLNARRAPELTIDTSDGCIVIRLHGWDVLYCFRRRIVLALQSVESVYVSRLDLIPIEGLRWPGTGFPGLIRAGSYRTATARDFWDVRTGHEALVIETRPGGEFRRVILELADARSEALRLRSLVRRAGEERLPRTEP